jgi:hypothetical protein
MRNNSSYTRRLDRFSNTAARLASFYSSIPEPDTHHGRTALDDAISDAAHVGPRFLSVESVARIFDVSKVTVYREIRCGRFPAVRLRGRYVVPAKVVAAMEDAAMESSALVDPADWVQTDMPDHEVGRPRPGANQSGAGSFSTQHLAGYGEDATPADGGARGRGVR